MFVLAFQLGDLQFISRNGFRERLEIFSKRVQDLDKCLGIDDALFLKYLNEKKAKVYHHLYKEIYVYFFLSIPIPGFVPSDRFAWNGPLRLSFTDRRNSSLRSSDTTGRAFGNPNRTLVPAPMVFRHKTLHLTAELTGKENTTGNLQ